MPILQKVADAAVATGYGNAGQVCISTQRIIALGKQYDDLLDILTPKVAALRVGDQLDPQTQMGPMVREADAVRVAEWIEEARVGGARVLTGGKRRGDGRRAGGRRRLEAVDEAELRGIVRAGRRRVARRIDRRGDRSRQRHALWPQRRGVHAEYRLGAQVCSPSGKRQHPHQLGHRVAADLMPYGGLKDSGLGKEGPKYAVQEMTETKTVIIHG
jgi:hypothetical protein